jgi:hypothetical protein
MELTGENRSTRGKTCPSTTLSTTNLTWNDPGSNTSLRGDRPATNRLRHGTAMLVAYSTLSNLTRLLARERFVQWRKNFPKF